MSYSASDDSVYYKQMIPEVVKMLPDMIYSGRLGDVEPGSFYLLRFESRIIWMQVIERGYGYLTVSQILCGLLFSDSSQRIRTSRNFLSSC